MRLPRDAHPNNWLNANCSSQLQAMNSEKGHSFARHRFNSVCGRSSAGRFTNSVARSGDLLSSVLRRTGSRQETRVSSMGEIIASLDGYFCLPGHNFDWNTPEYLEQFRSAPDLTAWRQRSSERFSCAGKNKHCSAWSLDLRRSCLPLQSNDPGRLAQW